MEGSKNRNQESYRSKLITGMNLKQNLLTGAKGFFMGAANVVPGVSGGTIALIAGIYEELIGSLNSLMKISTWKLLLSGKFKEFWAEIHGTFLLSLATGIIISIFSLAKLMEWCLATHPIQTWSFFFGLILASAFIMLKDVKDWQISDVVTTLAGAVLGLVICTLSPTETTDASWFIFVCGALAICTMILPGISGSFILVILGKYDFIMSAVSQLDFPVLIIFALGCIIGIMAFAKFLHWLLERYERSTMLVLTGFVIGSLVKVWPWSDKEALTAAQLLRGGPDSPIDLQIPSAIIWCIAGLAIIAAIEILNKKKDTPA